TSAARRRRRLRRCSGALRADRRPRDRFPAVGLRRDGVPAGRRLGDSHGSEEAPLSWAAHDLEPYAIQRHSRWKIAFVPLLLGSYSPDMMTKWFVYGVNIGGLHLKAHDPAKFHRGWPGFGFTHSLLYGVVICLIFWKGL